MDCCSTGDINNLNATFKAREAARDARRYRRKGLDRRAQRLIAPVTGPGSSDLTVLDIGCGAGSVILEMLRRGVAARAVGVDAAEAYVEAAAANARHFGLSERATYQQADFALAAECFAPADVVVLDRAICCYPDLPGLLRPAAQRAHRYLILSMPVDRWWSRIAYRALAAYLRLVGSGYRPYLHAEDDVREIAAAAGLEPVDEGRVGLWRILAFRRAAPVATGD